MRKVFLSTILSFGLLITTSALAAAPVPPNQFYGTVSFSDEQSAPDGTIVQAKINDGIVAECPVEGGEGKYGYNPILCFVTDPNGDRGKNNDIIHFFVNGIDTNETTTFQNGASVEKDFSLLDVQTNIEKDAGDVISTTTVAVVPGTPTIIKMGDSLNISISSEKSTSAIVEEVKKIADSDFSGAMAVLSGKKLLNGYRIKIKKGGDQDINILVTMKYNDDNIKEDEIAPYRFDETQNKWVVISSNYAQDKSANTITFEIPVAHTPYALFGTPVNASSGNSNSNSNSNSDNGSNSNSDNNNNNSNNNSDSNDGSGGDTVAPSVSDINVQENRTDAVITWKTNEPSISWIAYGTTTDYGKESKKMDYVTKHSIKIKNLTSGTTYHFQVKSKDKAGNIGQNADKKFTTQKSQIKGDINDDNKVNKYDFALMMSEWGKTGSNIASDLNNDNKVNKYDFSLLMVNWTK